MTVDPPKKFCRDYLDLCPTEHMVTDDGGFCVTLDHKRGQEYVAQFGSFTVATEILNQLAVLSVRITCATAMRTGTRILPASLRNICIEKYGVSDILIAHIQPIGDFYRVDIHGLKSDGERSGFSAGIYVANVAEPSQC